MNLREGICMSVKEVPSKETSVELSSTIRYQAASGKLGKVIIGRLLPGTDVIEGIEKICKESLHFKRRGEGAFIKVLSKLKSQDQTKWKLFYDGLKIITIHPKTSIFRWMRAD